MKEKQNKDNEETEPIGLGVFVGIGSAMCTYIYTQNMTIFIVVFVITTILAEKLISSILEVFSVLTVSYIIYRIIIL